jgi:hypothetical protein
VNRLLTGLHATTPIIPGEDARERQAMVEAYLQAIDARSQPVVDAVLVVVDSIWRLRRIARCEDALRRAAEARARHHAPREVAELANTISVAEVDLAILRRVMDTVTVAYDPDAPGRAQRLMTMHAVVIDLLLGGVTSVADIPLDDAVARIGLAVEARAAEVHRARGRLDDITSRCQDEIDGNVALAGLLDDNLGTRLARERAYAERSLQRAMDNVQRLRGSGDFRVMIAAEGSFAGPNSPVVPRRSDGNGEVVE